MHNMHKVGQLLSVAVEKSRKLLSVAACACEHKMHFPLFSYWQQVFTARARKQQLTATCVEGAA